MATAQCETRGVDIQSLLEDLPEPEAAGRRVLELDDARVLVRGATVVSVTKAASKLPAPQAAAVHVSEHAKGRMRERGVTRAAVAEALATPRLPGGMHVGASATVVVGTQRAKGQAVKTAWQTN